MRDPRIKMTRSGQIGAGMVALIICTFAALVCAYVFYAIRDELRNNLETTQTASRSTQERLDQTEGSIQDWQRVSGAQESSELTARVSSFTPELVWRRDNLAGMIRTLEQMRSESEFLLEIAQINLRDAQGDLEAVKAQSDVLQRMKQEEASRLQARLSEATRTLRETKRDYDDMIEQAADMRRKTERELRDLRETFEEERRRHRLLVQRLRTELGVMLEGIRAKRQEFLPDVDARIVLVDAARHVVRIDIGEEFGAKPGMILKVFKRDETGERVDKGRIQIVRAEEDASVAEILDTLGTEAMIAGDAAETPLFPLGRTFCVIGLFPGEKDYAYRRWELIELIERFGGKVVDGADLGTDYLITGHVENYVMLRLSSVLKMRGMEYEDLEKWYVERTLGRRFEELNLEELRQIMDGDVQRRNDAFELRIPSLTMDEFLTYVVR